MCSSSWYDVSTITCERGLRCLMSRVAVDAVHLRHHQVHQDDIGREVRREQRRLAPRSCLADHLEVTLGLQQRADALAHDGVVVHDHHRDRLRRFTHARYLQFLPSEDVQPAALAPAESVPARPAADGERAA